MNRNEFFALLPHLSAVDMNKVQNAYWLVKEASRTNKPRDTGERAFEHPRDVALLLIERGYHYWEMVVVALLHDLLEDTFTPPGVLVDLFGHSIWRSLFIVSKKVPAIDPITGEFIGHYKKIDEEYYGEIARASLREKIVKSADRLRNLRTMGIWEPARQKRYAEESRRYVLPIASDVDAWFAREIESACARYE